MNCFCCYRAITFHIILISSLCCIFPVSLSNYVETSNEKPFSYSETDEGGPKHWGAIKSEWKICETGKAQSPIDLMAGKLKIVPTLGNLKNFYKAASAVVKNRGHDITVRWTGDAGRLSIDGNDYKLVQAHWHSLSEHRLNGTRYELEAHLVHQTDEGKIAVIAILYKYGQADPFLTKLFPSITKVEDDKEIDVGTVDPGILIFDDEKYYRYMGSLTVPPCTEGVTWTIMHNVRTVSKEQVMALREAVHDGYEMNGRPIQPLNDREVMFFDATANAYALYPTTFVTLLIIGYQMFFI